MTKPSKLGALTGAATLASAIAVLPVLPATAQEIEEVVVTGSLIKRDSFDMSTPLDVMDEQELAEQGTPNLGEVLRNSTYNYGVESVGNILAANPQTPGFQFANFRGLGAGATLTLLDGRRGSGNLANTYPQIMIQRTEALTDGGATLYGTDAVGGVFNIIPKKDFTGIEVQYSSNQADGWWEDSIGLLAGGGGDSGSFVVGIENRRKDALNFFERPEYWLGSASYSSTSWPGDFRVANRDALGNIISSSNRPDPGCGLNNADTGLTPRERKLAGALDVDAHRQGIRYGECRWEFGRNFDYMDDQEQLSIAAVYEYQFSDRIVFSGELMYARNIIESRGSPSNPGGRTNEVTAIPGENPGNPYRAFYDADLDGNYEPAGGDLLLFAQDANGDGLPDRNTAGIDADGNGKPDVIVVGNELNPNGGIPFNEDVLIVDWRPTGYPFVGPSRLHPDRTSPGAVNGKIFNLRWVNQVDFDINDNWSAYADFVYQQTINEWGGRGHSLNAINAGINGNLLVRDEATASSRLAWFNPFTTQNYACVNRDCSGGVRQTDPNQINTTDIYDQISFYQPPIVTTTSKIYEVIASGDLGFELPGGTVQAAVGLQYRDEDIYTDANLVSNALDTWIGVGEPDSGYDRQTTALFGELLFPVTDQLEIDFSMRTESVDDQFAAADLDHTDYRLGARFELNENVAFRASWNTSFIAPSFTQLYAGATLQGLSQITDPWLGISAFTARTTGGTRNLKPEEADSYNAGVTVFLLEGDLRIDVDYKFFDFTDRIIRPAAQEVLDDEARLATAAGFSLDAAGLAAWNASGQATPGLITRSDVNQQILLVITDQVNATKMQWKGFDISMTYNISSQDLPFIGGNYGDFQIGFDSTFVQAYDYTSITGIETEGAGKRNNQTAAVPATPEWKTNARLGWSMGNHQATIIGRYMSEIGDAGNGDPFCGLARSTSAGLIAFREALSVTNPCPETLDSFLTFDMQYSLTLPELITNQDTQIQVGLINAFDKKAEALVTLGGLETSLYDPRNRVWYVRVKQGF
ncbi:MAG: TonB-dependent receptor plug domain-containing protein [Pseudomonadota bacterium]